MRYNVSTNWEPPYGHWNPWSRLARTRLERRFLNSTERRPSRCVRVEVHERADMLKVLRLGAPCVARIRHVSHQPWLIHHNSRGVLPETCRVRVWLGGLEVMWSAGRIWEPVRHKEDLGPAVLRRCGVHVATSWSSRASTSLLVQKEVLHRIPRYRNPKQRSRAPHAPHASTTLTYRILEVLPLCPNLNEA